MISSSLAAFLLSCSALPGPFPFKHSVYIFPDASPSNIQFTFYILPSSAVSIILLKNSWFQFGPPGGATYNTSLATRRCLLHKLQIWPLGGDNRIDHKFGHQVALLASVAHLASRWRHFHCYIALDCIISFKKIHQI